MYPFQITATTAGLPDKILTGAVVVTNPTNCAMTAAGNYTSSGACDGGAPEPDPQQLPSFPAGQTEYKLRDIVLGSVLYMDLDCINNTLVIPMQEDVDGDPISGTGTFTATSITYYLQQFDTGGLVIANCTVILNR